MKKNKAKQMLLSLGLMATVTSPLVTVISCGESDGTAPEITVDQTTTLDGETVQGSGTEYTLSLIQGTTITQGDIEGLFTVEDDMDEDVTLTYNWDTTSFEAATTGECVLTISSEDAAGNSVAYTLTITVSPPEVEGAGSSTGTTSSQGGGSAETTTTLDITDVELKELVTFTGSNGSGTYSVTDVAGDGYKIALDDSASDSTSGSLSNGDKLTFTVSAEAGYTLGTTPETFTVTVSGLTVTDTAVSLTTEELQALVSFTGDDGSGSVSITPAEGITVALADATQDGSFSNEDVVTFTVSAEAGYTLGTTPETFTVTVSGLTVTDTAVSLTTEELQALVSFTGDDGSGSVSITPAEGITVALADATQDGSFSNEDVVTFTVSAEAGYTLGTTPETFTVTVSGLDSVVTTTL